MHRTLVFLHLLLTLCLTIGMTFAQDDHSHDSSSDHSDHGSDHSNHGMDMMGDAQNSFIISEQSIMLDPIILEDGSFQLGVRLMGMKHNDMSDTQSEGSAEHSHDEEHSHDNSDSDSHDSMSHDDGMKVMMPALSVLTPSGEIIIPMMVHGSRMDVMTFPIGMIEAGIYRVSMMMGEDRLEFPLGVYTSESTMTDAYLVLAPNPSLSSRGKSQTFLYGFRDGEPIHGDIMLQRSMAGMQHMTDEEELSFAHTHFNDLYDDAVDAKPMSNEMTLSFAMAGTWDINVMLMGDIAETLNFEVEVLNE